MPKSSPWILQVQKSVRLTPNMQRITFGGAGLAQFPAGCESGYLKMAFPMAGASAVRSYTIRRFDPVARALEVDFVVHASSGPGAQWAIEASEGDVLSAGGPGPARCLNQTGDWYLILGDMSALPAIAANLEQLDDAATGYALIEILDAADRQQLSAPAGIDIRWIVNPDPARSATLMLDAVRSLEWRDGICEAWVASELDTVRRIRSFLKADRGITRQQMYASSYWQLGSTDEEHRVAKKLDQEKVTAQ